MFTEGRREPGKDTNVRKLGILRDETRMQSENAIDRADGTTIRYPRFTTYRYVSTRDERPSHDVTDQSPQKGEHGLAVEAE